jgi:hypothetical protein
MKEALAIFVLAFCAVLGLLVNVVNTFLLLTLLGKEGAIMSQEDDLVAAAKAAADEEASLETRVDGIIAALKLPHDSPVVAQTIADLEALKTRESAFEATAPTPAAA